MIEQEIATITDSLIRLGREFGLPVVAAVMAGGALTYLISLYLKRNIKPD